MNDEQSTIDRGLAPAASLPEPILEGHAKVFFADFEFDPRRDELRRHGVAIPLRPKPHALLRYFLVHPQRLIGKSELLSALWGTAVVTDDSLVQCVGELRAGLRDQAQVLIKTLPRRGYMFDAPVSMEALGAPAAGPVQDAAAPPALAARRWLRQPVWIGALVVLGLALGGGGSLYMYASHAPVDIDREILKRQAIGVIPFADLSDSPLPRSLSEGLTDEVSAQIAGAHRLLAIRGASSMPTGGSQPDISRSLGEAQARYLLTGSMARRGDGVAIDAQLTAVADGQVVWSDHYEYKDAADPETGPDMARRLVSGVRLRLAELNKARVNAAGYRPDMVELVLAGWDDIDRRQTREDVRRGRQRFEEALQVDPRSVVALTGLGAALMSERFGYSGETPPKDIAESERVAQRAMQIAPNDAVALILWGNVLLFRGQPDQALPAFEKATRMAPTNANAYMRTASVLMFLGRPREAQDRIETAMKVGARDPRIMAAGYYNGALAAFMLGDEDRAYALARRVVVDRPTFGLAYALIAAIDALHGRQAQAETQMAQHLKLIPHSTVERYLINNPTLEPTAIARRDRIVDGMRKAGLPER
ncbi:winged helix-turn-helix domain-containing protein [Variovorax sp. J22R133]|uniref:winged helix-turn-helix domain-containing tetratricopeptide repeat protein n=1 Tax=Variovorax brevis TaxID=3053503 RepID=UPI002575DBF6|nr:winged helix-turn-helix domain-containing protein [Variovorax sp. J22R133]MDM0116639.1 winged helix-turn-helix domain-containing protein [Variovorax sp. J22R133]